MSQQPILQLTDVFFRYDKRKPHFPVGGISLSIYEGEWVTLVGDNGSGKSTLAKVIAGLYPAEKGSIQLAGIPLSEQTLQTLRKQLGIIFQNPDNQFIGTSVEDDVAFALENQQIPREDMKRRVEAALKEVDMLDHRLIDPSNLSGGQKQRVQIAGLLALNPKLMILDEAFVMLDPKSRRQLLERLNHLKQTHGLTILSISHDRQELEYSDRLIYLEEGIVKDEGTPEAVLDRHHHLMAPIGEQLRRLLVGKGYLLGSGYLTEEALVNALCE